MSGRVPPVVELAAELDRHFDDRERQECPCGWRDTGGILHLGHVAESLMPVMLRVFAEHGDTQQVREQIDKAITDALAEIPDLIPPEITDVVMSVVAPIVAARDAAVERAEDQLAQAATDREGYRDAMFAARADLAAARQQLDQVRRLPSAWIEGSARHLSHELGHMTSRPDIEHARGFSGGWNHAASLLRAILDAPARPAGHDESGQ